MSAPFAITRQVTGPGYSTAYVWQGKHAVLGCKHRHRTARTAQRCAQRLLRMYNAGWRYMDVNWRQSSSNTEQK